MRSFYVRADARRAASGPGGRSGHARTGVARHRSPRLLVGAPSSLAQPLGGSRSPGGRPWPSGRRGVGRGLQLAARLPCQRPPRVRRLVPRAALHRGEPRSGPARDARPTRCAASLRLCRPADPWGRPGDLLGLGQPGDPGRLRGCSGRDRPHRSQLTAPPIARARPGPVAYAGVRRQQPGHAGGRARPLHLPPGPHPLAALRLGLLPAGLRPGRGARGDCGRLGGPTVRQAR